MKKILSVFIVLSLLLPSAGCFWNEDNTTIVDPAFATYTGTLKSLGSVKVGKLATHMIQTEDGEIVYVYSNSYDLDDSEYLNKNVEVYGTVNSEDDGKGILDISKITLVAEAIEVATAIEQSYSDQELGFSWNILSDWTIEKGAGYATFTLPLKTVVISESSTDEIPIIDTTINDYIAVKIFDNTENLTLTDWLTNYDPDAVTIAVAASIGIDSSEALKIESELGDTITYFVKRTEGGIYEVSHYNFNLSDRSYYRNMFMDALSTFKFIPFGSGSGTGTVTEDDTTVTTPDEVETVTSNYDSVVSAIGSKITEIAPEEESVGGTWYSTKYEFADPNYVYVEYEDGHDMRKVLLSYSTEGDFTYDVLAYFVPGSSTTWELSSGTDEAKGLQKTVVKPSDTGSTVVTSVLEGYSYLESASKGFSIQYPSSWYYAGSGNHYSFSSTSDGDELVGFDILEENLDAQTGSTITLANGKSAKSISFEDVYETYTEGFYGIYVERDDNSCFYVYGSGEYGAIVENMAGSITVE
ncbi:MAG: hypothetical protein WCT46_01860, partial [Candidatus Gracilibacteria bacterium]